MSQKNEPTNPARLRPFGQGFCHMSPALAFFLKKVRFGANPRLHLSVWPASINSLSMVGIGKSAIAASNA